MNEEPQSHYARRRACCYYCHMHWLLRLLCLLAVFALAAPAASALAPATSMSVSDSSVRAQARSVTLTLRLHYEMQCGRPGPGPLSITLPQAFAVSQVRAQVDGKPAGLSRFGHQMLVALPPLPPVMCDVIGPGVLTVKLSSLGNPAHAGRYLILAARAKQRFQAQMRIGA